MEIVNSQNDEADQLHAQIDQLRNAADQLRLEAVQLRLEGDHLRYVAAQFRRDRYRQEQLHQAQINTIVDEFRLLFPEIVHSPTPSPTPTPIIIKKVLSKEESETCVMDDDCVICLAQHKMTDACTINCGHQFGSACLSKWKKDTCPLCRTKVTETTVYIAPLDVDVLAPLDVGVLAPLDVDVADVVVLADVAVVAVVLA
jgi:regulator of replication initiation timing